MPVSLDAWIRLFKPSKISLLFIVGIVLVWGGVAYDLHQTREQALQQAQTQLENLTRIYTEEVAASISTIDYVLIDLRNTWKRNRENFGAEVEERRAYLDPSVAYNVSIIDPEGSLVFASAAAATDPINVKLNDREHFRVHLFNQADRLHISEPVLLREAHRWAIQFSRPLLDAKGDFDGVVVVSVSPEYFHRLQEYIDLGQDGSIALGKIHGSLIARYPAPELALGKSLMHAPWIFAPASENGFFQKHSEIDQIERLYAWRVLEKGDMAVIMGQSLNTILASYHQRRLSYLWGSTIATVLLFVAAYVVRQYQRQRAQAKEALQQMKEELAHAQKLESLGQLTGGVTHDFNHVLQIISSNIELLKKVTLDNTHALAHLNSMAEATQRGTKLAAQLLTFARRQPLHPTSFKPDQLLAGIDSLIQRLVGENIELKMRVQEGIGNIKVDASLLENVILNLVVNARDAMQGRGTLRSELTNKEVDAHDAHRYPGITPGEYVSFAISDTGSGMSRDVLTRAFEPFFTTKPAGQGTGLGLAMAYGFVKESGGHIHIDSVLGTGTTIRILLPRAPEMISPPSAPPASAINNDPRNTDPRGVLIVEDKAELRNMTALMLESLGYRVWKAASAHEALRLLETSEAIDVLFTDINLPGGIDGVALATQAQSLHADLTVILASGYDDWSSSKNAGTPPEDFCFLNKPYTVQEVDTQIKRLLSEKEERLSKAAGEKAL